MSVKLVFLASSDDEMICPPRIVQVTNFQETDEEDSTDPTVDITNIKQEKESDGDDYENDVVPPCEPSLFTVTPKRDYPWLTEADSRPEETYDEK
jgi:hypothetical protein